MNTEVSYQSVTESLLRTVSRKDDAPCTESVDTKTFSQHLTQNANVRLQTRSKLNLSGCINALGVLME